ncbi:MAG: DUF938 domain-containing protein [Alphaproteobacteria bacterium]|nr:MAG: DUF938 domain-containing protein [Alphaproteobacteria bacterium]
MTRGAPGIEAMQHAPAAARNTAPILAVLRRVLPPRGVVLEIASGSGQHVAAFAAALPALDWQPSDPDPHARASIAAWCTHAGVANVRPPLDLDTAVPDWPGGIAFPVAAMVCINMIHIAPWRACQGLMRGAGIVLPTGAVLVLYGPFRRGGRHTAASNAAFDRSLRQRNPAWGVRDLDEVAAEARGHALHLCETVAMPANNLTVVFRRA